MLSGVRCMSLLSQCSFTHLSLYFETWELPIWLELPGSPGWTTGHQAAGTARGLDDAKSSFPCDAERGIGRSKWTTVYGD